jgi:hypothetical protein
MTPDEINKVLEDWEQAYIRVILGPDHDRAPFWFAGLFVWALPDGIAWETPEVFGDIPSHSGHRQPGTWRRISPNVFEVTVPTKNPPGDSHTIQVYNWATMQDGRKYEDLVAARKGRTKRDLIRERKKLQPTVGIWA